MRAWATLLVLGGLLGCAEQSHAPLPRPLTVAVFGEVRPDAGALRAATGWFTPGGHAVVDDQPLVDDQAVLHLDGLPPSLFEHFRPLETARFEDERGQTFAEIYVLRPRVMVYDDRNRNGRFDLPFEGSGDVVVAVDRGLEDGVAWLPDVLGLLNVTPPDHVQALYRHLGGALHPFVRVRGARELRAKPEWPPFVLEFGDSQVLGALLACPRYEVFGQREGQHTQLADPAVATSLRCDPSCRDQAFAQRRPALDAPADSLPIERTCLDDGVIAVYRARQTGWLCAGCLCAEYDHEQVLIADSAAPPDWWPCGPAAETPYCEDDPRCGSTCAWRVCDDAAR